MYVGSIRHRGSECDDISLCVFGEQNTQGQQHSCVAYYSVSAVSSFVNGIASTRRPMTQHKKKNSVILIRERNRTNRYTIASPVCGLFCSLFIRRFFFSLLRENLFKTFMRKRERRISFNREIETDMSKVHIKKNVHMHKPVHNNSNVCDLLPNLHHSDSSLLLQTTIIIIYTI